MNKLNLLASLAAAPALTPGTVLVANQNLGPQDIFDKIPGGHKIDKTKWEDIVFGKIHDKSLEKNTNINIAFKLSTFYGTFKEEKRINSSLVDPLFEIFEKKETKAFLNNPTKSFIDYFTNELIEEISKSDLAIDNSKLMEIIKGFIKKIEEPQFLYKFKNKSGLDTFKQKIDEKLNGLVNKYNISKSSLVDLENRIIAKYPKILEDLINANAYQNSNEPYIKQDAFDNAIINTIDEEIANEDVVPLIAAGVQKTIEDEFTKLLQETNNIDDDFSKKTIDYLKYYLIDKDGLIPGNTSEDDYFFSKLFGDYKNKKDIKDFWEKWFGSSKDTNIDVNIRYDNFSGDNSKGKLELAFNVKVNGINAFNPIAKPYEVIYKSDDTWEKDTTKAEIENIFKDIPKIIKEWENDGYKISEDLTNPTKNFWDVLKQEGFNLSDKIKNNSKLNDINLGDFELTVSKQEDKWIFKISIDKNLGPTGDHVAKKYNHLIMDQIPEVEFQTIIYGIKKNLLKTAPISTSSITDEDLKRSKIYSGIYQDDLKEIINVYSDKIIPLKELDANGKLRSLFMTRYTTSEIDTFIHYIKDLSLNNDKYSMDNSNGKIGKIGKIGYKIITNSKKDKILGFNLVIDNEKGATKEEVVIPENNLRIEEYQNQEDRFDKWLYNAKINAEHALVPGSPAPSNKWEKLKKIIPDLDPDKKQDEGNKFYLNTFARIFDLVDDSLEKHFEFKQFENVWKVIFTLNNGQKYEKIISLDALTQAEKDAFKNKTNNRLNEIKGYIDKIQDQNLKAKIEDIYQVKRSEIDNLLNNLQTKDDAEEISNKVINLVSEVTESISEDEKEILLNEVKKRYPNGVPEEVEEKIKRIIKDKKNKLLNKTRIEIENILDNGQDLYKDIKNIDIEKLLNINKTLTNFEKYGIIAIGGVLAFDSVAAGAVAYGISRKNKKLANTSKTKMKRAKSLIIFNLAISLLTAGGSVAMFILIFIIKGGL